MAFAVFDEKTKHSDSDESFMSALAWGVKVYHLVGTSGGARQHFLLLQHILKVLGYAGTAIPCFGDDAFLRAGIKLYM